VTSLAVVEGGLGGKVVRQGVYSGLVEDNVASCTWCVVWWWRLRKRDYCLWSSASAEWGVDAGRSRRWQKRKEQRRSHSLV